MKLFQRKFVYLFVVHFFYPKKYFIFTYIKVFHFHLYKWVYNSKGVCFRGEGCPFLHVDLALVAAATGAGKSSISFTKGAVLEANEKGLPHQNEKEVERDPDEDVSDMPHPDLLKLDTRSLYEQLQTQRDEKDKVFQQELKGFAELIIFYLFLYFYKY